MPKTLEYTGSQSVTHSLWVKDDKQGFVQNKGFAYKNFLLGKKMRLEISGGPLGVKFKIQGHLGAGKGEKHALGQNCPKPDATI